MSTRTHTVVLALAVAGCSAESIDDESASTQSLSFADGTWMIHAIGKRCWDLGDGKSAAYDGAPVTLRTCNAALPAQQIRVYELADGSHDVILAVPGSTTRPTLCVTANSIVTPGTPMTVMACQYDNAGMPFPQQRFAYDGDAVMMGTQGVVTRDFIIEPTGDVTTNGVQLVVGMRDLTMSESFRMSPVSTTRDYPTTGFVFVTGVDPDHEQQLVAALALGWGTVVTIDSATPFPLSGAPIMVPRGVTIRGYRFGLDDGPLVQMLDTKAPLKHLFNVQDSHVRMTGLRLGGPSEDTDHSLMDHFGISVEDDLAAPLGDVIVDHIQGYAWPGAAIDVEAADVSDSCPASIPDPRPVGVRLVDNFLHQNQKWGMGYGAVVGHGGYMQVTGSVMYGNRHSIAAEFTGSTGYIAQNNFVLSETAVYSDHEPQHDFDKHGQFSNSEDGHVGGISDYSVTIDNNIFLGGNRWNIKERGTPCGTTTITRNRFVRPQWFLNPPNQPCLPSAAICTETADFTRLVAPLIGADKNVASIDDPTATLAVGDFDGDGHDDVFVATGNTWWFSSGGQSEWRFLNAQPEAIKDLRFGDLDGDGRTDVFRVNAAQRTIDVSWGGESAWIQLAVLPANARGIADVAVGAFHTAHVVELFVSDGTRWWTVSSTGVRTVLANQTLLADNLRFGDFDGDGRTDVLGVVSSSWKLSRGGTAAFVPWGITGFAFPMSLLHVADFDGDGIDDVMMQDGGGWSFSKGAATFFTTLRTTSDSLEGLPIGRFDSDAKADVLAFRDLHLFIYSDARDPAARVSIHDLR